MPRLTRIQNKGGPNSLIGELAGNKSIACASMTEDRMPRLVIDAILIVRVVSNYQSAGAVGSKTAR